MIHWLVSLALLATLTACSTATEVPYGVTSGQNTKAPQTASPNPIPTVSPTNRPTAIPTAIPEPIPTASQSSRPAPVAVEPPSTIVTNPAVASLNLPVATVISVGDGDTLRMDYQGQNITVRLACLDAPETSQIPWGPAATERLRQLAPRGSAIQFRAADTDRYGRMVAEIYVGGQSISLQMVREGHAVVYTQYLNSCPDTGATLLAAEAQARQQRLNFWRQDNPVMPWDYRRGTPTPPRPTPPPSPATAPQGNCSPAYPDVCIPPPPPDLNCGDIPYRNFRVVGSDPHRFDGDRDGIGCES